jgi:hypothetical protein
MVTEKATKADREIKALGRNLSSVPLLARTMLLIRSMT